MCSDEPSTYVAIVTAKKTPASRNTNGVIPSARSATTPSEKKIAETTALSVMAKRAGSPSVRAITTRARSEPRFRPSELRLMPSRARPPAPAPPLTARRRSPLAAAREPEATRAEQREHDAEHHAQRER